MLGLQAALSFRLGALEPLSLHTMPQTSEALPHLSPVKVLKCTRDPKGHSHPGWAVWNPQKACVLQELPETPLSGLYTPVSHTTPGPCDLSSLPGIRHIDYHSVHSSCCPFASLEEKDPGPAGN